MSTFEKYAIGVFAGIGVCTSIILAAYAYDCVVNDWSKHYDQKQIIERQSAYTDLRRKLGVENKHVETDDVATVVTSRTCHCW